MPIFISHRSTDTEQATAVHDYLSTRGVRCYIDKLDKTLQTTDNITEVILSRIKHRTHMMAVVSQQMRESWRVPFEYGVATDFDRCRSSFKAANVDPHHFLSKWPILKSNIGQR